MSESVQNPEERRAEEERDSFNQETERKLDEAIEKFAAEKGKGGPYTDSRRWDVVKAAVSYALYNNASYLDEAEALFRKKFEFYAKDEEEKKRRGV